MRLPKDTRPRPRHAGAALELALILPLLVMLVLGCIDFGRFAYSYIAITNAARAGAGYGIVHPSTPFTLPLWEANIRQAVANEMQLLDGFDPNTVTITKAVDSEGFWWVEVAVPYQFQLVTHWPALPQNITMNRAVAMRGIRN